MVQMLVRVPADVREWVMGRGGAGLVRGLIERAMEEDSHARETED